MYAYIFVSGGEEGVSGGEEGWLEITNDVKS